MTSDLLTDNELKALIAMVEVGQEGPVEIVFDANMAITKLQRIDDATLAQEFVDEQESIEKQMFASASDDFILGVLYQWLWVTRQEENCCDPDTETVMKNARDALPFVRSYL